MSEIEFKNHKEEFDRSCPLCDVIKVDGQLYVHISKVEVFQNQLQQKENIIKEVREKVNKLKNEILIEDTGNTTTALLYAKPCCRKRLNKIEEILDKEEK